MQTMIHSCWYHVKILVEKNVCIKRGYIMGDQLEARLDALERNQEEFGHDLCEIKKQLAKLTMMVEGLSQAKGVKGHGFQENMGAVSDSSSDQSEDLEGLYDFTQQRVEPKELASKAESSKVGQPSQATLNENPYFSHTHSQQPFHTPQTRPCCHTQTDLNQNQPHFLIAPPTQAQKPYIPIPIPELFPLLVRHKFLTPVPLKTIPNPFAGDYDPRSRCEYHLGAIGHSTLKCRQLEQRIEDLINDGTLTLEMMEQWKLALIEAEEASCARKGEVPEKKCGAIGKEKGKTQGVTNEGHQFLGHNPQQDTPHYFAGMSNFIQSPRPFLSNPYPRYPISRPSYPHQFIPQPAFRPQAPMAGPAYTVPTKLIAQPNSQKKNPIDPIPMAYSKVFSQLFENHLVAPICVEPLKPPYPKWYDASTRCEYHFGNMGHSIENCTAFKIRVQGLVKAGVVYFENGGLRIKGSFLSDQAGENDG